MEDATIAKGSDKTALSKEEFKKTILDDYKLANVSREMSLL